MFNLNLLLSRAAVIGATLLAASAVPQLRAGEFPNGNLTTMTFSGPVELSGEALPAGTYVFKTLGDNRNIVEVMNADSNHLVALVNAIPVQANSIPGKTEVELKPGAPDSPPVVHAWFTPGDSIGWEFPTPKKVPAE
jgi:hypothetical protein